VLAIRTYIYDIPVITINEGGISSLHNLDFEDAQVFKLVASVLVIFNLVG